jgi:hypothetical protein
MGALDDLIASRTGGAGRALDSLIAKYQCGAAQPSMPRVPMSGLSPEEDTAALAEMNSRGPKPQPSFGQAAVDAYTRANNDPFGSFGGAVGKVGEKLGILDEGEGRGERFGRGFAQSLGPLGVEFAPLANAPRAARAPAPTPMPRPSVRSEAELRATGGARIGEAKQSTATVDPGELQQSWGGFTQSLRDAALKIDADLHPTAARIVPKIEEALQQPQSLDDLHILRQKAQAVIEAGVNRNGKPNQEGLIGIKLKSSIDDMIGRHPEGSKFKQGTSEYARAEKSAIITEAIEKAKTTAQWNRGDHAGAIRNAVKPLINNKANKNRWTKQEAADLRRLTRFGLMEMGGAFGSTGIAGLGLGRAMEVMLGIPPFALFAAGAPLRMGANARRLSQAERIAEKIRAGGPVAEGRLKQLGEKLNPKVLAHIMQDSEGAKRVAAWATSPSVQTARALGAYTSAKLKVPELAQRIASELQGDEQEVTMSLERP